MARTAHHHRPRPLPCPARRAPRRGWLLATTALLPVAAGQAAAQGLPAPNAAPSGGQVVAGQAAIAQAAAQTTITQTTDRATIDWQQFNVGSQHTVQFLQPSQGSWTLNRVVGPDPSVIAGRVQSNGGVAIVNRSGVVFADGAQVDVGALIGSAAGITTENFMAGRMVFDQAPRPGARVENRGTITVADRGLAALVAPGVSNSGVIRARLGRVALGAAETFVLDLAGDGLIGLDVTQAVRVAPSGGAALVTNDGVIAAPGGSVLLSAHAASGLVEDLVRQTGLIEAPTLGDRTGQVALRAAGGDVRVGGVVAATGGAADRGGRIAVQATGTVRVARDARVDASGGAGGGQVLLGTTGRGRDQTMAARTIVEDGAAIHADATGAGNGGMLVLNSLEATELHGALSARGGSAGGDGGFVELSGQGALVSSGTIDLRAPAGGNGELLLDPRNIIVSNAAAPGNLPAGETITFVIPADGPIPPGTGTVTAAADADTTWTRVTSGAITGFSGTVTLDASRDIIVASAVNKNNGGLTLIGGRDVTIDANISLSGGSNNLTITAGRDVVVDAQVRTAGTLSITAGTGSIALNAPAQAPTARLEAATGIAQAAGAVLRNPGGLDEPMALRVTVTGTGDARLGADNGRIMLQGGSVSDGGLLLRSVDGIVLSAGQTLSVNGAAELQLAAARDAQTGIQFLGELRAASLAITANRAVPQDAASVITSIGAGGTADPQTPLPLTFSLTGADSDLGLNGTNNGALRVVSGSTADSDVTLRGAAITVAGPLTAGTGGARDDLTLNTAGDLAIDGQVTARNLIVNADGAVTQTIALALGGTGGGGANGVLRIRALDGAGEAGSIVLDAGNVVSALDARSTGLLRFTGAGGYSVLEAYASGIALTGGAITVANAAGITGTGSDDVRIVADSLAVNGGMTAAEGRVLSLQVDALTVGATGQLAAAGDGTIEIAPRTPGFVIQIASAGTPAATLVIDPADVAGATAGTLQIGQASVGEARTASAITFAADLTTDAALSLVSAGTISLGTADVAATSLRMAATGGAIDLGTGTVRVNGASPTVTLLAGGGSVTQGAGGTLVGPSGTPVALAAHAAGGTVALAGVGDFTLADGGVPAGGAEARSIFAATGSATVTTTGALTVAAAVEAAGDTGTITLRGASITAEAALVTTGGAGTAVTLTATGTAPQGGITQTADGVITAGTLNLSAPGAIALDAAGNTVAALGTLAYAEPFAFRTTQPLVVSAPIAATGGGASDITLRTAADLTINAPVTAGAGMLTLESGGAVQQAATGATITAGELRVAAGGAVDLAPVLPADFNAIGVLGPTSAGGPVRLNIGGDLSIDGIVAQAAAPGTIEIETTGALTLGAGGAVAFSDIRLRAAGTITLDGSLGITGGAVSLATLADIAQGGGSIQALDLIGSAAGDVTVAQAGNDIRRAAIAAGGDVVLATGGTLATGVSGLIVLPGGGLALADGIRGRNVALAAEALTITAPVYEPIAVHATAPDGTVTLRTDSIALTGIVAAGTLAPAPGDPVLDGTIDLAARTAGRGVVIGANDPGALALPGADVSRLEARHLVIGSADPNAGGLVVRGSTSLGSAVASATLQGSTVAVDAPLGLSHISGTLTLRAGAGDVTQTAAGVVTADRLVAEAPAGSVRLDAADNAVRLLAGSVASGLAPVDAAGEIFTFGNGTGFTVSASGIDAAGAAVALRAAGNGNIQQAPGAPIVAASLAVSAGGSVMLDGGGVTAGTDDLNRVQRLASADARSVTFVNGEPLTVGDVTTRGSIHFGDRAVLQAPALTLEGRIEVPFSTLVLRTDPNFDAPASGGPITQTGGLIVAAGLAASAAGDILLPQANQIGALAAGQNGDGSASANSIVTGSGGTFLLLRDVLPGAASQDLDIQAPVVVGTGGTIRVFSDGLDISYASNANPSLPAFVAPGGIVHFVPFTAGSTIGLGGAGGLDGVTYGQALFDRVQAGRLVIGGIDVAVAGLGPIDTAGSGSGTITLRGPLDLTGAGAPAILELHTNGDIVAGSPGLSVPQISAFAGGSVTLGMTGATAGQVVAGAGLGSGAGIAAGGTVQVSAPGMLSVSAPILADGASVALRADDFALAPGATVRSGAMAGSSVTLADLGGTLTLGGPGSVLSAAEIGVLDAQGGTIRLEGQGIRIEGPVTIDPAAAVRLDLAAAGSGSLTQVAGGTVSALELLAQGGTIALDGAGNSLNRVQATALGDVRITTDGAMEVRGVSSTSQGAVVLQGSEVTLGATNLSGMAQQAVQGGSVELIATTGDVTGGAGLASILGTVGSTVTAAAAINLPGANATPVLVATAGTDIAFANGGALTVQATAPGATAVTGNITLSGTALALNDVLAAGTVDLGATLGGIGQNAGVRLAAGSLRAAAPGSILLAAADASGAARNQVRDIDLLSSTNGSITLRNADALTIDLALGVGAGQVLTLEAPTLTIGQDLSAGAGGRIVLRTGAFDGPATGGDITQTGGAITTPLLAALAGGDITLDGAGNAIGTIGGGLSASGAPLMFGLSAGGNAVLRSNGFGGSVALATTGALGVGSGGTLTLVADDIAIGADILAANGTVSLLPVTAGTGYALGGAPGAAAAGVITIDTAELERLPSLAPASELRLGAAGVSGSVTIAGVADLMDGAAPRVGRLVLAGDGSVTQQAGTRLEVAALSAHVEAGSVMLDPGVAGNRIAALDGIVAGGDVVIRGGAGMMALRDGGAGDAVVAGSGSRIVLRADDIDIQAAVRAPGGVIAILPETAGTAITLGAAAPGTLALETAEIARLGGAGDALGAPGAARLIVGSDGATRMAGDILIAGNTPLRDGVTVRVGTLELVAGHPGMNGGSVRSAGGTVDVATLTGTAQGDFGLALTGATTTATGVTAGTRPGTGAAGQVDIAAEGGLVAQDIAGAASVRLAAGSGLRAAGITAPVVALEGDPVTLAGVVRGATSVTIASGGAVTQDPGAIIATGLLSISAGSIDLPQANEIREIGAIAASGPVLALHTIQPLLVGGAVSAVSNLSLSTDQGLTLGAGSSIDVTGAPGATTLTAGADIALGAGSIAVTGAFTADAATGFAAAAGTITAGGDVRIEAGGGVRISSQISAGSAVGIAAGGAVILQGGKITAPGAVAITGNLGVTMQSFQIDPTTIVLRGGPEIAIDDSLLASSGSIALSADTIRLGDNRFETNTLDVSARDGLTLNGGTYTIGRAVVFSAPGGIETVSTITVRPQDTLLPAIVFDVRAAAASPDPLAVVQPDIPDLPSRQQATQVRIPGTEAPGTFGRASSAPGGNASIDIDAGRSAVFLLLDGGSASGTIVSAGRLGIHGTGGVAELYGALSDTRGTPVGGAAAATYADSTRPAEPGAITRYRLNGCVVSSVNCIVPNQVATIPQALPERVELRFSGGSINDPDVMMPNISAEDY